MVKFNKENFEKNIALCFVDLSLHLRFSVQLRQSFDRNTAININRQNSFQSD